MLILAASLRFVKQNETNCMTIDFLPTNPKTKENTAQRLRRFVSVFGAHQIGRESFPAMWSDRSVVSSLFCAQTDRFTTENL